MRVISACLDDGDARKRVEADLQAGLNAGVEGTPTFFLNGVKIEGAVDRETLKLLVDEFVDRSKNNLCVFFARSFH
jgi:protein-disulfide isomerase